jgi:hypothetical protein
VGMGGAEGRRVLFVGRRGDRGVRARGWKAGAIVAGDLGFGCARKTTLIAGPMLSAAGRVRVVRLAGGSRGAAECLVRGLSAPRGLNGRAAAR